MEAERTTKDEGEMYAAVAPHWTPMFQAPDGEPQRIEAWLPDTGAMEQVSRLAPRTAPGLDGIPHQLWQVETQSLAQTLTGVLHALAAGAIR